MPKTTSNPSFLSAAAISFASLAGLRSAEACAYAEFPTTSATRRSAYATDEIVRKKLRAHKMTRKGPSPREGFISELSCSMNRANDAILALQEQDARRPSFLKDPLSSTIAQADPFSRQRSRCLRDLRVEVRRGDTRALRAGQKRRRCSMWLFLGPAREQYIRAEHVCRRASGKSLRQLRGIRIFSEDDLPIERRPVLVLGFRSCGPIEMGWHIDGLAAVFVGGAEHHN